ncbi:MAG TPA: AraC family transcriptional regulator [Clostridiaceae bacterium]
MQAWHQKTLLDSDTQLNIFIADISEFPPHWHEAVEVVYILDGNLKIGVNSEIYTLNSGDILLINGGDVHYFLPNCLNVKRIILHFEMSYFEAFTTMVKSKRFKEVLFKPPIEKIEGINPHQIIEKQMLNIFSEYNNKNEGYKLAMKARLFDIMVILIRYIPTETYSFNEMASHLKRLERLDQVFQYVEDNHDKNITLVEIASVANFSIYHFTRFFKEATGMTFGQYLNNYRVSKAIEYFSQKDNSVTEVAFLTGFGSIRTFNRVFKQVKGYSPSAFIKTKID